MLNPHKNYVDPKLERGETTFSDEIIEKIAYFFNITPAEFELPMSESIYVGSVNLGDNSNSSTGSNSTINTIDEKIIDSLREAYNQNRKLFELLIAEKDKRIYELKEKQKN